MQFLEALLCHKYYIPKKFLAENKIIFFYQLIAITFTVGIFAACHKYPPDIEIALLESGSNRNNVETVLLHYREKKDTLGYKSAILLLKNMSGIGTSEPSTSHFASDLQNISSSYLIENIDLALEKSKDNLIKNHLNFNDFCEYILPYRLAKEKLTPWRRDCQIFFSSQVFNDSTTIDKLLFDVNNSLRKGFEFSYSATPPEFQSWEQLNKSRKGDCWSMTSTSIYPLRALGLPVSIDFVPVWGNINGGSHPGMS